MSVTKELKNNLKFLDFDIDSPESGLLFVGKTYGRGKISFSERLVLKDAVRYKATAVYFRRFESQAPQPQLFIFDNTNGKISEDDLGGIHKKVWTSGVVPLYYVFDRTSLRVFDAKKPVDAETLKPMLLGDVVELVAEAHKKYERFSAKLFVNGSFWEQEEFRGQFKNENSSSRYLIEGLKKFKEQFLKSFGKNQGSLANQLLVQSILVKYLEERRDEQGNPGYKPDFFSKYCKGSELGFCGVIRNGRLIDLFDEMSRHFNGKIFEISAEDKTVLKNMDLSSLAAFLDADQDVHGQGFLWRLYEFGFLPVELISRIYEEFLTNRTDAVYTPVHLAKFIVDECMPVDDARAAYKVIDPSCGSGVFLVTVFKRLVQWRQKLGYEETQEIKSLSQTVLKNIIKNSLYGIDVEDDAVRLTAFSLSIALCDMLTPMQIWNELKFDNLRDENLKCTSFQNYMGSKPLADFDLVIGNPPFEDQKSDISRGIKEYNLDVLCPPPRNQIAMLFLDQSMRILKQGGQLGLVIPSGPFLYNQTGAKFKKKFFETYTVQQVADFSALSEKHYLFEASPGTAVVFAQNKMPSDDHRVLHITVRRSKPAREQICFEIDHYDFHWISQEIAKSDPIIWKTNLFGGGELYRLISYLMRLRSFGEYLKEQKKNSGWAFGEGYNYGNRSKKAPHLTGHLLVETSAFTEQGIVDTKTENEEWFEGTREKNKAIFKKPHLLVKEVVGNYKFMMEVLDRNLIFKHKIIGIHAPNDFKTLKEVESVLQKNYRLYKTFLLAFSSQSGITMSLSIFLNKDFMALPFPEDVSDLDLSENQKVVVDDFLKFRLEAYSRGESAKANSCDASKTDLKEFSRVFCRNLNSLYQEGDEKFQPHPDGVIETRSFVCLPFAYGKNGCSEKIPSGLNDGNLKALVFNQKRSVLYHRVLYCYQPNLVYLIKPKKLRYWMKSVALQDAAQVIGDLAKAGL
ncbi:MAG: N-6 DNA methylase [Kiritimatiellales bacterium]